MFSRFLIASLFTVIFALPIFSLQVSLQSNYFTVGKDRIKTVAIKNPRSVPVAVEVSVRKRKYDINGVENFNEIEERLIAIPNQMILSPGIEQVISLRWAGDTVDRELPLRIVVEDVPIPTERDDAEDDTEGEITLTYRIVRSFYVRPNKQISPNIDLPSFELVKNDDTPDMLAIQIENTGTKHQVIRKMSVDIDLGDASTRYDIGADILNAGINLLPGEKRQLVLNLPDTISPSSVKGVRLINVSE